MAKRLKLALHRPTLHYFRIILTTKRILKIKFFEYNICCITALRIIDYVLLYHCYFSIFLALASFYGPRAWVSEIKCLFD